MVKIVVISEGAYKGFILKWTFVTDYVMTGLIGHLNLLGWCDCNILLHGFIWVVLRSYGGGWREGGGFTLEVVVGMEGCGVGLFEGSRLCRFLLFYNPQTPFDMTPES